MLIDWINDVLVGERIIVKDLAEDLYDGQVLQKLFGKTLNRLLGSNWDIKAYLACGTPVLVWTSQLVCVHHLLSGKFPLQQWHSEQHQHSLFVAKI